MKHFGLIIVSTMFLLSVAAFVSLSQEWKENITITCGTFSQVLTIGCHPGNTIGFDFPADVGEDWADIQGSPPCLPPYDFDAALVTIPRRDPTFPKGLGSGVFRDIRGYYSPTRCIFKPS
jgi:hypothetical protein